VSASKTQLRTPVLYHALSALIDPDALALLSSVYFCIPTKHKILHQDYRAGSDGRSCDLSHCPHTAFAYSKNGTVMGVTLSFVSFDFIECKFANTVSIRTKQNRLSLIIVFF